MTLIIVCSFFTALFTFFLLRQLHIEKGKARKIKENTYLFPDGRTKVLSNAMAKEIKSKNYGSGSWYKKRPGKNKGL